MGDFYTQKGKYDAALPLFKESLQTEVEIHNEQMQSQVVNNIGNTYLSKGDFDNARTLVQPAGRSDPSACSRALCMEAIDEAAVIGAARGATLRRSR